MHVDTIVAIATPTGYGGIGIIRISGSLAYTLLCKHTTRTQYIPWKLHRTNLLHANGMLIDDILAVYMPAPNTFTGEDIVELHCHGSPVILNSAIQSLVQEGARIAERGEFSKRALLNNRLSLSQAEAIIEVIHAPDVTALTFAQKRLQGALAEYIARVEEHLTHVRMELYLALDFPEEDLESIQMDTMIASLQKAKESIGHLIRQYQQNVVWQEGATVLLAGSVNAGKSSLFNAILGTNRALVSNVEGTTRDYVTERISLQGIPITLMDTAGLRKTTDAIEQQGIEVMKEYATRVQCILFIVDATKESLTSEENAFLNEHRERCILVYNKMDKEASLHKQVSSDALPVVHCSALELEGIDVLMNTLYTFLVGSTVLQPDANTLMPNARQYATLCKAHDDIVSLCIALQERQPFDAIGAMLEYTLRDLQEITGYRLPEDILNTIFESFCIGK